MPNDRLTSEPPDYADWDDLEEISKFKNKEEAERYLKKKYGEKAGLSENAFNLIKQFYEKHKNTIEFLKKLKKMEVHLDQKTNIFELFSRFASMDENLASKIYELMKKNDIPRDHKNFSKFLENLLLGSDLQFFINSEGRLFHDLLSIPPEDLVFLRTQLYELLNKVIDEFLIKGLEESLEEKLERIREKPKEEKPPTEIPKPTEIPIIPELLSALAEEPRAKEEIEEVKLELPEIKLPEIELPQVELTEEEIRELLPETYELPAELTTREELIEKGRQLLSEIDEEISKIDDAIKEIEKETEEALGFFDKVKDFITDLLDRAKNFFGKLFGFGKKKDKQEDEDEGREEDEGRDEDFRPRR